MNKTVVNLKTGKTEEVPMTDAEVDEIEARRAEQAALEPLLNIKRLEIENPITHRGQREFYLGFGDAFPQFKETHLYKEAKRVDDAIKAERAKL
jgi:hypothetical protein